MINSIGQQMNMNNVALFDLISIVLRFFEEFKEYKKLYLK